MTPRASLPLDQALTATVTVRETRSAGRTVTLDGRLTAPDGALLATAALEVAAPAVAVRVEAPDHRLDELLERCRGLEPVRTAVVHPLSADALEGALDAAAAGLVAPILFGPEAEICRIADTARLDLSRCRIVSTENEEDSTLKAARAAGAGEAQALMKGSLHTDVLLHAVMQKESGLRT
ncbi:hypothetical protein [Methylosinus sp. KRF6]|uniref:hypothetical protein n=1 Tax=Methylosinus sp. KRF6 TaxID=2846853 RepID=UPI001C0E729C|nr:hypothetical protein [Methylosinus sp. KRF6]MBU3887869.1 hypothetical protein [Methylosinus sp. KRF6]